jgi:hypothetical protein
VDASRDAEQTAGTRQAAMDRFRTLGKILVIDVAAPLATYYLLRAAGFSSVSALLLSGVLPALGFVAGIIRSRHIDVVGALVLTGIVVGTVLGLVSHSSRLVLMEGSVPTAIFGLGCLGTLWTKRPLMYGLSLEFIGHDTPRGREMTGLWQYAEFRRIFRVITAVWGVGFLLEAALRAVIVYNTSPGTALAISKVMPYIWVGAFTAWTIAYGTYRKKNGERETDGALAQVSAASPQVTQQPSPQPADQEDR